MWTNCSQINYKKIKINLPKLFVWARALLIMECPNLAYKLNVFQKFTKKGYFIFHNVFNTVPEAGN